jgi:hypothetical protein
VKLFWTFSAASALLAAGVALAAGTDVDIHVVAKKVDATPPHNESERRTVSKEHWNYEVSVENASFKPMAVIDVRYMIFYKTEELGSKAPAQQRHQSGSFSIDALPPHGKKLFSTSAVELNKSHLIGYWHYAGGERIKAEDALAGIWVRVYQGAQLMGEYANPSTLSKEQWQ